VIGRVEIPRLGLTEVIIEGAEASALRCAVGHIPGTALPGSPGNVGIAGHRDRSFRRLKDAQTGDWILVVTPEGSFHYRIASLSVVSPIQTSVLAASKEPKLTLVTCYPFHYVGRAPRRFIVEAHEVVPVPEARGGARSSTSRAAVAWPLAGWPWLTARGSR
jgi:sortase A